VSETEAAVVAEEAPPKKKGIPTWLALLVILICLGVVYQVYTMKTADKVTKLPNNKISSAN